MQINYTTNAFGALINLVNYIESKKHQRRRVTMAESLRIIFTKNTFTATANQTLQ